MMNPRDSHDRVPGRRTRFGRLAIGILLVAGATGFLVYKATGDNLTYYREVDELLAAPGSAEGKIRLSGDVVEGSIVRSDVSREIQFAITSPNAGGESARIPVVYSGSVPDIFKPGIQVVVEGSLQEDGTFRARTLLAKCPSKYQAAGELNESGAERYPSDAPSRGD